EGLISQRQLERSRFKLEGAQQEVEKSRLATKQSQSRRTSAQLELEKTVIRAPFAGLVIRRHANSGAGILRGDKLFEIAQLTALEVKFQLPPAMADQFAPGQWVSLSPPQSDQIIARARISRSAPVAEAASNTLSYVAEIEPGAGLLSGQAVNV